MSGKPGMPEGPAVRECRSELRERVRFTKLFGRQHQEALQQFLGGLLP